MHSDQYSQHGRQVFATVYFDLENRRTVSICPGYFHQFVYEHAIATIWNGIARQAVVPLEYAKRYFKLQCIMSGYATDNNSIYEWEIVWTADELEKTFAERLADIEEKLDALWFSPGMPGSVEAASDFKKMAQEHQPLQTGQDSSQ